MIENETKIAVCPICYAKRVEPCIGGLSGRVMAVKHQPAHGPLELRLTQLEIDAARKNISEMRGRELGPPKRRIQDRATEAFADVVERSDDPRLAYDAGKLSIAEYLEEIGRTGGENLRRPKNV